MPLLKLLPICIILIFSVLSMACKNESSLPAGIVASVNGEPIALHSVQALMDSRSPSGGVAHGLSLEEMRKNYANAVGVLIVHALLRQDLQERGIEIGQRELEKAIAEIEEDYDSTSLDQFLVDASLRKDDWHQLMRDHLALEIFRNRVLRQEMKIELQEIKDYYASHKNEFHIPANMYICLLKTSNKETLAKWCDDLKQGKPKRLAGMQCMDVVFEEIPDLWQNESRKLQPRSCGKILKENDEWHTLAVLEKREEHDPTLLEVYPLVENILRLEKQKVNFDKWLEKRISQATILISPELQNAFLPAEITPTVEEQKEVPRIDNAVINDASKK